MGHIALMWILRKIANLPLFLHWLPWDGIFFNLGIFLNLGIFIPGILDFLKIGDFYPRGLGIFIPENGFFFNLGIFIPGDWRFLSRGLGIFKFWGFYPRGSGILQIWGFLSPEFLPNPGDWGFFIPGFLGDGDFFLRGMGYPTKKPPLLFLELFWVFFDIRLMTLSFGEL